MESGNPNSWNLKGKVLDPFNIARTGTNNHGDKVMDVLLQVAPDSKIHMLSSGGRELPGGGFEGIMMEQSLPHIDSEGIHLVNASLTGLSNKTLANRMLESQTSGSIFVTAAENTGKYDSIGYSSQNGWITVSASHINKSGDIDIADYSSRGKSIDFTCFSNINVNSQKDRDYKIREIGTSFASPMFCGMLALVQQFFLEKTGQTLNQDEMYKFVVDNAVDLGNEGRDNLYGHGIFVLPNPTDIDVNKYIRTKEDVSMGFKDVKYINWHYDAVKYVTDKGFMKGYSDGTFRPDEPLTRAEYAQAEYNKAMKEGK